MGKYDIEYFRCCECRFIQTEQPYWLDEAYQDAIIPTDVGLVRRNQTFSKITSLTLRYLHPTASRCVDYGGGYGMFTRMMRDLGHDFVHLDPYCQNLFAKGFEADAEQQHYDFLTAFEVWEHMADPQVEIAKMDQLADHWLISTVAQPDSAPRPGEWWYYATEGGQHVALWSEKALQTIAQQYGRQLVSARGGLHLFSRSPVSPFLANQLLRGRAMGILQRMRRRKSLLQNDYQVALEATSAKQSLATVSPTLSIPTRNESLDAAVAFITFNRPTETAQSFQSIREARPSKLFLISDAARPNAPGEAEKVEASRRIAENVDWDCEVVRIYASENLGCGRRVSSGITEAFEHVDRLIILEDDCIPDPTFFSYCKSLLDRYQDDTRVTGISGNNFQQGHARGSASYYFSRYLHCWGWATWRRAWQNYDLSISKWPALRESGFLESVFPTTKERKHWTQLLDSVHEKKIDTWDFQWLLHCWSLGGLNAHPNENLVTNIGFGPNATHTTKGTPYANMKRSSLAEITHCDDVVQDTDADKFSFEHIFNDESRKKRRPFWKRFRLDYQSNPVPHSRAA
ncbi:class I SAM-dependent methyltransferase [Novipirellula artificiosorum]|uniref:Methyltransferase domain protein n=1 Tax=Novipirellula artificiosorum TaxID=2528016 RepID=A0A5C6DEQ3_9BACT|nr:class I SAM-dependent methyltransferase [Novipirellula artificiosorum]TWU34414.1 hypothetical protein Poly41_45620 [Novipirellula artificiosorum]